LIHQDVKPPNFLIRTTRDAGLPDLLLTDFGVAKFIAANSSNSQSVRGTPSYMAPEQWEGNPVIASDQYALAIMVYQLVTGRLPFQGGPGQMMYQHLISEPPPPSTHSPALPVEVDAVILQALAKKPEDRFDSITAFAHAFQQATRDSNATAFHFTSQNPSVPTVPSTQDRTVSSDPYATVVTRPPEEHRPPLSGSDERRVITGNTHGSTIRETPTPAANSRTVSDHLPEPGRDNRNIVDQVQQAARRKGRGILPTALALLALLLIAASVGSYYFIVGSQSPFAFGGAHATATAQAREQSTAAAQATAHAKTSASATAQRLATATARAISYSPYSGTLVINDPLSSNSKVYGWEEGERDSGFCTFSGGSYHSSIPQNGVFHSCLALATNFADFAFEVQATIISGSSSGIVFRADRATTHLYYFIIDENGNF
ncbi:MAG: serine/threonine protein kinase, partial [Chloroflexota bacterium]|nr:serine/threonine protein kinase [Chloroflexota bacterium]